eukprot:TRINITY_DN49883_c0_g1_i1.p1 TRINITY_DN49883_c0_g1~~TRINITY_DN49883_c0_g1_i1.p1  ORF type:complete len:190 (+),score=49.08 TRINITY_DN49883_c0_g1_i1:77-646(+)
MAGSTISVAFGRSWAIAQATPSSSEGNAHSAAWFDFEQLCDSPRGVADFTALGREYAHVFVRGVPQLSFARRDEARRFILLIDELYNHGAVAWCTAEVPMAQLFEGEESIQVDLEQLQFETEAPESKLRRDLTASGEVAPFGSEASASSKQGTLFTGEEEHFAFNRAISRLYEMQTARYLTKRALLNLH